MKRTSGGASKYQNSPIFSCNGQVLSVWYIKFKYWIDFFASLIQENENKRHEKEFYKNKHYRSEALPLPV